MCWLNHVLVDVLVSVLVYVLVDVLVDIFIYVFVCILDDVLVDVLFRETYTFITGEHNIHQFVVNGNPFSPRP